MCCVYVYKFVVHGHSIGIFFICCCLLLEVHSYSMDKNIIVAVACKCLSVAVYMLRRILILCMTHLDCYISNTKFQMKLTFPGVVVYIQNI